MLHLCCISLLQLNPKKLSQSNLYNTTSTLEDKFTMGVVYMLKRGADFSYWNTLLEGKLATQSKKLDMFLFGHVFHDEGIRARTRPTAPADNKCAAAQQKYKEELHQWTRAERICIDIILRRVDDPLKPPKDMLADSTTTAKAIYDCVVQNFSQFARYEYMQALNLLINTKFVSDVNDYIRTFHNHLGALNEAAWLMREDKDQPNPYTMGEGQAAVMFMNGTQDVEWLQEWRGFEAMNDEGGFASLTDMTRSLRVAAERRKGRLASRCIGNKPTDLCNRKGCRRFKNRTNEECFKR